jgi:predicted phage terminase large subunit-like protein
LSIDPAVSEKETADFTAMIVNGYSFEGRTALNVYKLDAEKGHWKAQEIARRALDKYKKYQCEVLVLETVAAQEYLEPIIMREAADRGIYVNIYQVKPHKDKVTRARGVSFFFEKGYMWFPEQAVWLDELLNEYKIFPAGQKDDYVDAEQMNLAYMKDDHNLFGNDKFSKIPVERKELACPEIGY